MSTQARPAAGHESADGADADAATSAAVADLARRLPPIDGAAADVAAPEAVELSIVMPCLNEADTIAACVGKARRALREAGIVGEVVVADNGSTDGSQAIARELGARVIDVPRKGYGSALMGGIAAARGTYVVMGDADDSYDFLEAPRFLGKLRQGYDLVQGCRLPSGGGTVKPGAMPFSHRWVGNPMLSMLVRWWFHAPIHDVYCGMRGFRKAWYEDLNQRCTGMEFATEMIIKSVRHLGKIAEVPITLHPDGRRSHPPHLRTFRDGWRTLRFFLMYCPRWLFLEPGKYLLGFGLLAFALALSGLRVGRFEPGLNALIFASLAILCGSQAVWFALGTKVFAVREGLMPPDPRLDRFFKRFTLERGATLGLLTLVGGAALLVTAASRLGVGWVIAGATLTAFGLQVLLSSFFISILGLPRK